MPICTALFPRDLFVTYTYKWYFCFNFDFLHILNNFFLRLQLVIIDFPVKDQKSIIWIFVVSDFPPPPLDQDNQVLM